MRNHKQDAVEGLAEPLTRRESEILSLLAQGFSAPEIAKRLFLALSSVKWHLHQLYGKLGVTTRQRALLRAGELGLLPASHPAAPSPPSSPRHNLPPRSPGSSGAKKRSLPSRRAWHNIGW